MALAGILMTSCGESYTPKPRAYMRIAMPEKAYRDFDSSAYPFTFRIPVYAHFEPVPVEAPEAKELKTQAMTDEKLEVVEVLGQTALFTNGRVTQKELPDGLYKYDLREGESIAFATVEPSVAVNHAGTIITKEPIIFGEEGYIEFDDDSSPNFLGDEMSIEEFLNTDFSQGEDESQTMGGMQL